MEGQVNFISHRRTLAESEQIVEPSSARIGDPGREIVQSIDANHMDMCRFPSKDDPEYKKVSFEIKSLIELALGGQSS